MRGRERHVLRRTMGLAICVSSDVRIGVGQGGELGSKWKPIVWRRGRNETSFADDIRGVYDGEGEIAVKR